MSIDRLRSASGQAWHGDLDLNVGRRFEVGPSGLTAGGLVDLLYTLPENSVIRVEFQVTEGPDGVVDVECERVGDCWPRTHQPPKVEDYPYFDRDWLTSDLAAVTVVRVGKPAADEPTDVPEDTLARTAFALRIGAQRPPSAIAQALMLLAQLGLDSATMSQVLDDAVHVSNGGGIGMREAIGMVARARQIHTEEEQ